MSNVFSIPAGAGMLTIFGALHEALWSKNHDSELAGTWNDSGAARMSRVAEVASGERMGAISDLIIPSDLEMRLVYNAKAPKRSVNLSLNEDLVAQVRDVTNNLSELVESLLVDFVSKEHARRDAHAKALKEAVLAWNAFGEKHGSFADEHSTL